MFFPHEYSEGSMADLVATTQPEEIPGKTRGETAGNTPGNTREPRRRRFGALAILLALLVGLIVVGAAARKWMAREYFPRNLGVVKEHAIYRSGQHSPRVLRDLCQDLGLKTILDLGGAVNHDEKTQAQRDVASDLGVDRFEFHLPSDGTGDPDKYVAALLLMSDPARQPVLVHCGAGAQRTSTATMLYRMIVEGQTAAQAYPEAFRYGHEADEWALLAWVADHVDYVRAQYHQQLQASAGGRDSTTNPVP
jgi:hypothetical protein